MINDLSTPFGNLDHVAIGPTAVFVMDTKNWRGVVAADGKGELLLNSQRTEKRLIGPFVARMLKVKEKVRTLAPEVDPFYEALLVFTAARVEAKWGRTGSVNCLTDDQLHSYIVEKDFGKKLKPEDVESLCQAFLALARMEKEFTVAHELKASKEAPLVPAES